MNNKFETEYACLDSRVMNLLMSNQVHQTYNTFAVDYQPISEETSLPEFYGIPDKNIFYKRYSTVEHPGNESSAKKEKKSKKKSSSKKKKKSSSNSESDNPEIAELSPKYLASIDEIYIRDPQGRLIRRKLACISNANQKIKMWKLLKDLVGKDLTRFALPVYLCEPMSMLQRANECWGYVEILRDALNEDCRYKRLVKVAAFLYIQYCSTQGRNKKPFNPLLGETFEYELEDFRILTEQVSHHPPVSAFHVENEEFVCWGHIALKSKLSISGLDISADGKEVNYKAPSTVT